MASPKVDQSREEIHTPAGKTAFFQTSKNFAEIVGASCEGLRITVLPITTEAIVIPA